MTEIIEYALVVMVSTLFVTGSAVVYDSFAYFESNLQLRGTYATLSELAARAVDSGTASARLSLPPSTIGCERGSLTLDFGSRGLAASVPANCGFEVSVAGGEHELVFTSAHGTLSLQVS